MINWGEFAPLSRLAMLMLVVPVVVMAMLTSPFPLISGVILMLTQVPVVTGPVDPAVVVLTAGALL